MRDYLTAGDFAGLSRGGLAEACLACSARFAPMKLIQRVVLKT